MDANRSRQILADLLNVTKGCRDDMHEPDNQGVKAHVVGYHLDNAMGAHIAATSIIEGHQEFVVCLERFDSEGDGQFVKAQVNLADLIALARKARL